MSGRYKVSWSYSWGYADTGSSFKSRIMMNANTAISEHTQEPKEVYGAGEKFIHSGFRIFNISGIHTFSLQFCGSKSNKTCHMWNATIDILRLA